MVELESGYPAEDLEVGVVSLEVEQGVDETSSTEEEELGVGVEETGYGVGLSSEEDELGRGVERGVEEAGYVVGLSSGEVVHGVLVPSG